MYTVYERMYVWFCPPLVCVCLCAVALQEEMGKNLDCTQYNMMQL